MGRKGWGTANLGRLRAAAVTETPARHAKEQERCAVSYWFDASRSGHLAFFARNRTSQSLGERSIALRLPAYRNLDRFRFDPEVAAKALFASAIVSVAGAAVAVSRLGSVLEGPRVVVRIRDHRP